jgi:hypothetical protein
MTLPNSGVFNDLPRGGDANQQNAWRRAIETRTGSRSFAFSIAA